MKYITNFINKISKIDYRAKFGNLLKKLRINKFLTALSPLAILISFIAFISKNFLLTIISTLLLGIIIIYSILFLIESMVNKEYKIIKIIFNILLFAFSVTVLAVLLSKIAYWIIPIYYPEENNDKIYDLVFNTYTTIISSVIGIAGTYFGAIYGGNKAIEATKIQLDQQSKDNEKRRKDDERFALRIISKLLSQEINNNFDMLKKNGYFNELKNNANLYFSSIANELKFEIYNNTKYELIKYSANDSLVEDVIDVYGLLDIASRYPVIRDMSGKDKDKLLTLESKIKNLISAIDNITIDDNN